MSETPDAFYAVYVPTWRDHFRRWTGYGRKHTPNVDANPAAAAMPGWFKSVTHVHLGFGDRIRLLISGKATVEIENRLNVAVDTVISDAAFSVVSPFDTLEF